MNRWNNQLVTRFAGMLLVVCATATSNGFEPNYDEAKIPAYTLPDSLTTNEGSSVTAADQWHKVRRPEILEQFQDHVYGHAPNACDINFKAVSGKAVFDGLAERREVDVFFGEPDNAVSMRLMIYVPRQRSGKVPAFLGLNFQGNHSVDPDPTIKLNSGWFRNRNNGTTKGNQTTDQARGVASSRWPIRMILERGYGLVTIYYGDIDPDFDDGFKNGIHGQLSVDKSVPKPARWGSIAAWAYGLSRALDFLQSKPELGIDGDKVAVIGHSRLGKTSLWAGASDPRFAMVISNNSGCGGAALSRRAIGETVGRINTSFPHWFCDRFNDYNENEAALPVDQHQLIALIAPRPVYVASATEDRWADPKGEFLSAVSADPVYRLLGTDGFGGDAAPGKMPAADQPISNGHIGYHLRTGKHDVTDFDWQQYLDFADRHLK